VSRRETVAVGTAALLAGFLNVAPAQAFLGFGEGEARAAAYKAETVRTSALNVCLSLKYSPQIALSWPE
jgi:hypothetical protein